MGVRDGEGQDLIPLGHHPCVDAVAGLGGVRVQVYLLGREAQAGPGQDWGKPTPKGFPSFTPSHSHSTHMHVLFPVRGALGWGSQTWGLYFLLS